MATYQAKTSGGKALSWTLGGTDVSAFRTSGDTLYFKQAPNYETPTDGGKNNQYDLTIRAVDGKADTTVSVRVSVSNEEELGTIAFTPTPPTPSPRFPTDRPAHRRGGGFTLPGNFPNREVFLQEGLRKRHTTRLK